VELALKLQQRLLELRQQIEEANNANQTTALALINEMVDILGSQ